MMAERAGFTWGRVSVAETLPILMLVAIVVVYSVVRPTGSLSPADFAPRAGMWVGPIGGFLATLLFAWWAARRAPERKVMHGAAVGMGTALLDLFLGILLGAGDTIHPILFVSNGGRILAGVLRGWMAERDSHDIRIT